MKELNKIFGLAYTRHNYHNFTGHQNWTDDYEVMGMYWRLLNTVTDTLIWELRVDIKHQTELYRGVK